MTHGTRIAIGLSGTLLVLAAVVAGTLYYLLTKSLPDMEGEVKLAGLSAPVDVYRDKMGVPHIMAASEQDAFTALGYIHAQDRLWQMDLLRRYGSGRLSEVLGTRTIDVDRQMRTIGISHIADTLLTRLSPGTRALLEAYSRGVNSCIEASTGRFPVEFDLLQYTPEPWTPRDCLIATRLMGWELGLSWWVDVTLGALVDRVGEDKAREVFPWYDDDAPVTLPPDTRYMESLAGTFQRGRRAAQRVFGSEGSAIGSNAWVVDGTRSKRRLPMLANDPHLMHMQPSRWYLVHLTAPGLNLAGVSLPGVPAVVIGRNDSIAWGMTNVMADDVDFYREQINLRDSTYLFRGDALPLSIRVDSILVRDSLPVPHLVLATRNGPVISDVYPYRDLLATDRFGNREALSMRWAGTAVSDEILALYRAGHASDWEGFRAAMRQFGVPAQNCVYADVRGNIGFQSVGNIPVRRDGSPVLPDDASSGSGVWTGFIPFDALPRSLNPEQGFIAMANNRMVRDYPYHLSSLWESESRITRILQLLGEQREFSADDFRVMQMDVLSPHAGPLRDAFVEAIRTLPKRGVQMTRAMNRLARWDLRMNASSVEASIFNSAWTHLVRNTLRDEMDSTLFDNYVFLSNLPTRVLPKLLADTSTTWFDDVRTSRVESRREIMIRSVAGALAELHSRFGPDIETWSWGRLHTVEFKHPLGEAAALGSLLNVGPVAIGGNNTTVNNGEYSLSDPYHVLIGPSFRFLADMAVSDTAYVILPAGQSGQPLSPHYADQSALWQIGAYHPLLLRRAAIEQAGWPRLRLLP